MEYKILNFNQETATITVLVEGYPAFALTLQPDLEGNVPTGKDLEQYIADRLPVEASIEIPKIEINNADDIHSLVSQESIKIVEMEEVKTNIHPSLIFNHEVLL